MTCKPISVNVTKQNDLGRAFFSVKTENDNVDLYTKNIYELDQNKKNSKILKSVIQSIWKILEIPGCYVTVDILKEVFNFESNETFDNIFGKSDISFGKTTKQLHALVKEKVFHFSNADKDIQNVLLQKFIQSKLGVLLLRHMIDLPGIKMKELEDNILSVESLNSIDKVFVKSPYCCFYVNDIEVERLQTKDNKYIRTRPSFSFEKKDILNEEIDVKEQDKRFVHGVCYVYGSVLSSYLSHVGNFYLNDDEFESRKQAICSSWNNKDNYMKRKGGFYSTPKWYDSYAGANNLNDAKYQLVLADAPPLSKYSTLSAMKRNLMILLYICRLHITHLQNIEDGNMEEMLEDMAESITQYFLQKSTKSPLKISNTSRCLYLKCEESVVRTGMEINVDCWAGHFERKGLNIEQSNELAKINNIGTYCYQNIKMVNSLSGRELTENDRLSLGKQNKNGQDESDSIIVLPLMLYSFLNTRDLSDKLCKVVAGMATQISPFQNSLTPFYVCKSSLLYGKKNVLDETNEKQNIDKDLQEIIEKVEILCKKGYSKEESYDILSLSSFECDLINNILDNDDDDKVEPNRKKIKTC